MGRLVVMMYARFALRLRNVEDLPFERGIDLCSRHAILRLAVPSTTFQSRT